MVAEKCFCYVRTDPDVPKHKGISVLIIDVDSPGVDVRPLRHMSGRAEFAEVFFTDVVVPKANLVGAAQRRLAHHDGRRSPTSAAGCGWRGSWPRPAGVDDLVGAGPEPRPRRATPSCGARSPSWRCEVRSLRALGYKGFATFAQGSSAPEHSYMKVATSELRQRIYELAIDLQGADLAVVDREVAAEGGRWQRSWMTALASTIGGGTSEIQRNVIATRVLGLPRS